MRKTKAAIVAEQQADERARIAAALRWSDDADIKPDVPPPEGTFGSTTGYVFNAYSRRVDVACSGCVSHAVGRTDQTTTQGARFLFSTRERALRALRCALEREFAAELDRVDREMGEE